MFSKYLQLSSCFTELKMNAEELLKAQAEALEMLADQQMRMIRDKEVQFYMSALLLVERGVNASFCVLSVGSRN